MLEKSKTFFGRYNTLVASSALIGGIVGAGILGIPYVVAKAGFLYGLIIIILLGLAFLCLHLFVGEIVLRTKQQMQLTGYAGKYLGGKGKLILTIIMVLSIYGALSAYLIGEGAIFYSIFNQGSPLLYSFIFLIIACSIIYKGMKTTGKIDFVLISLLLVVVVLIGIFSWKGMDFQNYNHMSVKDILFPYGVVLFAFIGLATIPEIQEVIENKKNMKRAIIIGSTIPIFLYILFTFFVLGSVGLEQFELLQPNERIATIALSIYSQPVLGLFANILAVLAMFTSFLALGTALVQVYQYDYNLSRKIAFLLTFPLPLLVVILNLTNFIDILDLSGAILGGLQCILIILIYWKAKKLGDRKPEYSLKTNKLLDILLIAMFSLGIVYEILSLSSLV